MVIFVINTRLDGLKSSMLAFFSKPIPAALLLALILSFAAAAQSVGSIPYIEPVANDATPVLIKHLPEWETVGENATFATSVNELKAVLGDREILDLIDFSGGTEAAIASYPAGKLLLIEYSTPQASIDADAAFTSKLAAINDALTVYRRIGNYNAFVFDAPNPTAANALLDQVKYEKTVQWLGKNPFAISAERAFVLTISDVFLSTVIVILLWVGFSLLLGTAAGYIFFHLREKKRAAMPNFTDAGGMTRLNLDGLTPEIGTERLLNE